MTRDGRISQSVVKLEAASRFEFKVFVATPKRAHSATEEVTRLPVVLIQQGRVVTSQAERALYER